MVSKTFSLVVALGLAVGWVGEGVEVLVGMGVGTVEQAARNKTGDKTAGRMLLRLAAMRLSVVRWLAREVELECVIFMGVIKLCGCCF